MTKILLIEDEDMLCNEVAEWLMLDGFEVLTANDGLDGANIAVVHQPDLIVCDIMMPRMDGYGVLLHVRSNSLTQLTPIIFMTAKVGHDDIRTGMNLGADDYITKPFTRRELLTAIQTQLDKREAQKRDLMREVASWRQALEQETEQRHLTVKMVGMFAHDFRNPLAAIMSSISIVRDYADRIDEQRRLLHLNRVEASVRLLLQMLDDMILFAQTDSGNFKLSVEPLNIEQFLQRLMEEFQQVDTETHRLHFESLLTDTIIITDPRLLRQIAANLISNAIKYSLAGTEVQVMLDKFGDQYILTVQDNGIGIPETDQPRLFSAFQRGSNVGDRSGTGLGLAIVQQATDLLRGSIHLESQVGIGTRITVQIPIMVLPVPST